MDLSGFHVITVVSNPARYQSRYRLYKIFIEEIERKGAKVWTIELQTGRRHPKITDNCNQRHFQIWTTGLEGFFWSKEMLQNYGVQQLTAHEPDWRYVCFLDADIRLGDGWLEKTAHALQAHPVVQPWSHAIDEGADGSATSDKMQVSFAYAYRKGIDVQSSNPYSAGGHPGYCLAMRRETYNQLGGLIDIGALGSGDRHMMCSLIGEVQKSYHPDVSQGYKRWLHQWQDRAERYVKRNIWYVPVILTHMPHGNKIDRQYGSRWRGLTEWKFDPYTDLRKEANGLWSLVVETPRQIGFRDFTYQYTYARLEDRNG